MNYYRKPDMWDRMQGYIRNAGFYLFVATVIAVAVSVVIFAFVWLLLLVSVIAVAIICAMVFGAKIPITINDKKGFYLKKWKLYNEQGERVNWEQL